MQLDARTIPAGTNLTADLCIIGAGAAGITLAMELTGAPISILLLESGGFELDPDTQALTRGEVTGLPTFPLEASRLRCFGGSTGHWGGFVRRFDAIDFEERPWVPHSGWPITLADVEPFYDRAQQLLQVGPNAFEAADWNLGRDEAVPLAGNDFRTRIIQFSPPTRFGVRYRDNIVRAPNVRLVLHANVTEIVPNPDLKQVSKLKVATLSGNRFEVHASTYVLATGGIENARVLLTSNSIARQGLANESDTVGRFFADHIHLDTAGLFPLGDKYSFDLYQREWQKSKTHTLKRDPNRSVSTMGYLGLSERAQREHSVMNFSAELTRTNWGDYFMHGERFFFDTQTASGTLGKAMAEIGDTLQTLWRNLGDAVAVRLGTGVAAQKVFYKVDANQEQAPNPDSRVTLGSTVDRFGVPHVRLNWQQTELDRRTLKVAMQLLAQAAGGSGLARLHVAIDLDGPGWPADMQSSWHHCGTTRMHSDPRKGVVNADCRSHSIANLYIAGSSVFTTDGAANPTTTLVALALRLAKHLRGRLR